MEKKENVKGRTEERESDEPEERKRMAWNGMHIKKNEDQTNNADQMRIKLKCKSNADQIHIIKECSI